MIKYIRVAPLTAGVIIGAAMFFAGSGLANAGIVTFGFEGNTTGGTPLSGTFSYGEAVDLHASPVTGLYIPSVSAYDITVGNTTWVDDAYARMYTMDHTFRDTFSAEFYGRDGWLRVIMSDYLATALSSDELPSSLNRSDWTYAGLLFNPYDGHYVRGHITSIKRIPEPGTGLLLGVGLILVGLFGYLGGRNNTRH